MMCSYGVDVFCEIFFYGKVGELVYDVLVDVIKFCYLLMFYIYFIFWEVSYCNFMFMWVLFMDFFSDFKIWNMGSEYMFGLFFLVVFVLYV